MHGGWPIRLVPLDSELLSSCLARNAYAHGSTPYRFLNIFWEHDPVWNRDFDRGPEGLSRTCRRSGALDWPADIAGRLGLPRGVVEHASLAGWRARLAGPRWPAGDTPLVLSAGVHHRTRTRHALQFCPECLAEGTPYFRKEWRLAFVVICPGHRRALMDGCGHCGAPVVPHRSFTGGVTGCHACGLQIMGGGSTRTASLVPERASATQTALLATLRDETWEGSGPWRDRDVFDVVRCLIAVSAPDQVHARLRAVFGLGDLRKENDRLRFEQCRHVVRTPWLELVAAWMFDWPRSFRDGADAAGLSRRSFARSRVPAELADEVARLPIGVTRDRTWVPILDEPVLRRLRRTDPAAYSRERAARILDACGRTP